ncbi:YeeE/YedE family protein [Altericroceibacterium spongiae]|uniref:YeeE/YedE family protein n=1 Tax=Altericroceibacterium spongiae TaxID=2320269 RepID=A0A420EP61_9SPHN|nr:DUF6691 family protein [Altericroceibacterium spongiae]RKF22463.1 YeeE/YedE family protein [Altericroceibacterium spongiae]
MIRAITGLLSGIVFGFGLALSGMMNPARVRGFLDLFGQWDPTLAFVMGGAILAMALAWLFQAQTDKPACASQYHLPDTKHIDGRLIGGAALFGIGWGLGGLCPGPGIASLATQFVPALIFVASMLLGMTFFRLWNRG